MKRTHLLACATIGLIGVIGCGDAVFFNRQRAELRLIDNETLLPVQGAMIQAARVEPLRDRNSQLTDQEFINEYGDLIVTTDGTGTVTYSFRFVSICGGPQPLAIIVCDRVQGDLFGTEYLFLVQTPHRTEILSGKLDPDTQVTGTFYHIAIGEISEPELVPTW